MEHHTDDTSFLRYAFGTPGEVSRVQTKGTELAIAATSSNKVDALCADTGVCRLTAFLECPKTMLRTWLK
jgi:hypothetical protein